MPVRFLGEDGQECPSYRVLGAMQDVVPRDLKVTRSVSEGTLSNFLSIAVNHPPKASALAHASGYLNTNVNFGNQKMHNPLSTRCHCREVAGA